jgi:hypothetical protein
MVSINSIAAIGLGGLAALYGLSNRKWFIFLIGLVIAVGGVVFI